MKFDLTGLKIGMIDHDLYIGPGDQVYELLAHYSADAMPAAILNVADDYPEKPHPPHVVYVHTGLNDGPEDWEAPWGQHNRVSCYLNAMSALTFLLNSGYITFVHCHGGVSRSAFIVAWELAFRHHVYFEEGYAYLKEIYPRANIHPKHIDRIPAIMEEFHRMKELAAYP